MAILAQSVSLPQRDTEKHLIDALSDAAVVITEEGPVLALPLTTELDEFLSTYGAENEDLEEFTEADTSDWEPTADDIELGARAGQLVHSQITLMAIAESHDMGTSR